MKYLLQKIRKASPILMLFDYEIMSVEAEPAKTMVARDSASGLMSDPQPITRTGLKLLFRWIDQEDARKTKGAKPRPAKPGASVYSCLDCAMDDGVHQLWQDTHLVLKGLKLCQRCLKQKPVRIITYPK